MQLLNVNAVLIFLLQSFFLIFLSFSYFFTFFLFFIFFLFFLIFLPFLIYLFLIFLPFSYLLSFSYFFTFFLFVIFFLFFLGAVSVISGLALFIGKIWVMTVAGIGGYYYMQGQYDNKVCIVSDYRGRSMFKQSCF